MLLITKGCFWHLLKRNSNIWKYTVKRNWKFGRSYCAWGIWERSAVLRWELSKWDGSSFSQVWESCIAGWSRDALPHSVRLQFALQHLPAIRVPHGLLSFPKLFLQCFFHPTLDNKPVGLGAFLAVCFCEVSCMAMARCWCYLWCTCVACALRSSVRVSGGTWSPGGERWPGT